MNHLKSILNLNTEKANSMAIRLKETIDNAGYLLPLTGDGLREASTEDLNKIEAIFYRFSKLQDFIGAKIFSLIVKLSLQNSEIISLPDTLKALEKLNIIPNSDYWIQLREIRNDFIHEYIDDFSEAAEAFNTNLKIIMGILPLWENIKSKIPNLGS